MTDETICKDGYCQINKAVPEKKPEDIFFAPIEEEPAVPRESTQAEDSTMRKRFIQYCDNHPNDVECKIYDV
ncbi:MAG TPA: hypothetical protein DEP13_08040 [Gammaproteobacteria bacterium]|nr:MAG: hypothetical protein CBD74_05970 [Saprospirales bacterium TMED214]HCA36574.1 hypothetical protein [Gammaproteobacteria bacterium]